jgi:hypothetical protein
MLLPFLPPAVAAAEPASDTVPMAILLQAAASVEKATQDVTSLEVDYIRSYNVFGQTAAMLEEGRLSWKRSPDGKVNARWDGKDPKGAVLTLVRDREMTVWRGKKKERTVQLEDPILHHASKFGFPLLPPNWKTRYVIGPPFLSPDFDDRWDKKMTGGIPRGLTFKPRPGNDQYTFKMVTFLLDEKKGLAYKYRCETFGWQNEVVEVDNWKVNPEIPDVLFDPPDRGEVKPPDGPGGGDAGRKDAAPAPK